MRSLLKGLVVLLLAMLLIVPILAQDVTEIAPVSEDAAPVEEVPVVVVEAPVVVAEQPATDGVQIQLIQVIIGLLTAFAAGGIVGIAGLSVFVQRLQKDAATVTALELLASSYPSDTKELLLGISRGLENIGKLGAEVFDGVPVAEKPVPNPLE